MVTKRNKFKKVNPSAAVLIYNYNDRLGTATTKNNTISKNNGTGTDKTTEIDQIILNSASLISVTTSKSKSQPGGSFEIVLAPWKNWVTAITPGSWCVILMGRTPIKTSETKYNNPKVDKRHFKMLGRIESVRCITTVDQISGALTTSYVVSGVDWGSVFNAHLYVDPVARTNMEKADASSIGTAMRIIYDQLITTDGKTNKEINLYDSTLAIQGLLAFWGGTDPLTSAARRESDGKLLVKAENAFSLPKELIDYMGFTDLKNNANQNLADILRIRGGVLTAYDTYSAVDNTPDEEHSDGIGFIDPSTIFGMHSMWQIMTDNCNKPLNEMIAEMRWEGDKPLMTLYKRVKPFCIRTFEQICEDDHSTEDNEGANLAKDFLKKICSDYKNIRRHVIASEEIVMVNAGTNWRDRFNFIEVLVGKNLMPRFQNQDLFTSALKLQSQFYDHPSIKRDGFTPMTMTINYLPKSTSVDKQYDIERIYAYKYLGKEWYFDTHKMLNGSITIIGQDSYIQVGDNIIFKAENLSSNYNTNTDTLINKSAAHVTAHVENISHRATVGPDGARSFITDIQFVRGIITNRNGDRLSAEAEQTLDQDANKIDEFQERLNDRVIGTSSGKDGDQDPDQQKLGHPGAS
jgi:hypothetical protein